VRYSNSLTERIGDIAATHSITLEFYYVLELDIATREVFTSFTNSTEKGYVMPESSKIGDSPEEIDGFVVLEHLGSGSFADTFRVKSPDEIEYALKWLRAGVDAEARDRFENEVWALETLDHRGIPKLIQRGIFEQRPYLVESLARGRSLRKQSKQQIEQHGTASVVQVLTILKGIFDALAYMHSRGILHRDIKDDNVIASPSDNHIFLIDFGYCKGTGQPNDVASFWNVGAGRYSPPKKLEHPANADPSHDIFAVGVLGYLLLTNQYPWDVSTLEDRGHLLGNPCAGA
jgi:serine/threonine protein kinase